MAQRLPRWQALLVPLMIGILAASLCAREKTKDPPSRSHLKFVTIAKDSDFAYLLHIYPHEKSDQLFRWTIAVKELSTGKIVLRQRALTMRGQENKFHQGYGRDGNQIKMTFRIHREQPILFYTIKRTRRDQVVYWNKGETKLEYDEENEP